MGYSAIKFSHKNQVVRITFNRPEARNAVNPELVADVIKATEEIANLSEVKAVVITGEGDAFSSGTDLKFLQKAMAADPKAVFDFGGKFSASVKALYEIPVPTIAMVNGFTFAAGIELMLACDMAIASEDARIGDQHMNRGTMGGPVMWQLPKRIGLQRAMELVLSGKWLTGKEAERYGLVLKAVPPEKLEDEVEALLAQLRSKSVPMLQLAKKVLRRTSIFDNDQEALKYVTDQWGAHQAPQAELKQGAARFVEKGE